MTNDLVRGIPGKPYRPSCGTEGEWFTAKFCVTCERDRAAWEREEYDKGCPILAMSYVFCPDDPNYPQQWVFDTEGRPVCTAYKAASDAQDSEPALDIHPRQGTLQGVFNAIACFLFKKGAHL